MGLDVTGKTGGALETASRLPDRWDETACAGFSEPELLLYRSNLLGSDLRVTNYGGGNTSAKLEQADPLTRLPVPVLWVKGSGGDLASIALDGFATLYLGKLQELKALYRGLAHEDEMADCLPHCTFALNPRATSIDTPPHCFIPHRHVDHMHADAIIALAAARDGERLTREVFGDEIGWIPWQRPGFDLGLKVGAAAEDPRRKGLVLAATGSSPGETPPASATSPRCGSSRRRRTGWARTAGRSPSARSSLRPWARPSAGRSWPRSHPPCGAC